MTASKARKKRIRRPKTWQEQLLNVFVFITAMVFMPTTILIFLGMMPTLVASLVDRSGKGTKGLTVGAMNLAGCTPFLIELWTTDNTATNALHIFTDPRTIVVIYSAAGIGYLIDWSMSGIIATIMVQRSAMRMKDIKKRQAALVERWGKEVTGEIPMDNHGFAIEKDKTSDSKDSKKAKKGDRGRVDDQSGHDVKMRANQAQSAATAAEKQ